jgi:homoserine dehydrogenase
MMKCLLENRDLLTERAGIPLVLCGIADIDLETDRGVDTAGIRMTPSAHELIHDPDVDVIVELVGGTGIAGEFIAEALDAGKDVVTANKALLAEKGGPLFRKAADRGRHLFFEGAVCGGIPIIDALKNGLSGAHIRSICGIVNGTCNYILTRMSEEGSDFRQVLQDAQASGYAEADPRSDVEGRDSAHKIAILASLAFGQTVPFKDLYVEGITEVSSFDIDYARELGYVVKLLAIAKEEEESLDVRVHPTMIPKGTQLSSVRGVFNAVEIMGDPVGPVLLYGQGAGGGPTGNAVASDLVQIARLRAGGWEPPVLSNFFTPGKPLKPMSEVRCPYYLRFRTEDRPGVIAKISTILGDRGISIASLIQHPATHPDWVPVVLMTHEAQEKNVMEALHLIDRLEVVLAKTFAMRVENFT